jgi:hypothetical protein
LTNHLRDYLLRAFDVGERRWLGKVTGENELSGYVERVRSKDGRVLPIPAADSQQNV